MFEDEELLQLSGIQRYAFCPRQWGLTHIESLWVESIHTVMGHHFHENAHGGQRERRGDAIISRGLPIVSRKLGLSGKCDVVEWRADPLGVPLFGREGKWRPTPIEYKRGKPGQQTSADGMQLCAQAMCLEEMFACGEIGVAQLYYGEIRRRVDVELTAELRAEVERAVGEMHRLFKRGHTPVVKPKKACKACSLYEECAPGLTRLPAASDYVRKALDEVE